MIQSRISDLRDFIQKCVILNDIAINTNTHYKTVCFWIEPSVAEYLVCYVRLARLYYASPLSSEHLVAHALHIHIICR